MHRLLIILTSVLLILFASCHRVDEWGDSAQDNFDALWTILDTHYCFFEEKGVDWDSVYREYQPRIKECETWIDFFDLCGEMLGELRDGHVNLASQFNTSCYKKWWSDYPQNYDKRLVDQYYLHFDSYNRGGFEYKILDDSVGYLRYASFAVTPSDATLDYAFYILEPCKGLIIDIRDNSGGNLDNVQAIVSRFINQRVLAGYICHKTGPGHNDFSEPYAYYFDPAAAPRIRWQKPVVVLTNRSTFSAANNFVSIMRLLPQVTTVGDRTGGGSGIPFNSEIPCGWAVRFSASPVYDAEMNLTESGLAPDIHVDMDPEAALRGHDTILDTAITFLLSQSSN